jgi:hypothetical protein
MTLLLKSLGQGELSKRACLSGGLNNLLCKSIEVYISENISFTSKSPGTPMVVRREGGCPCPQNFRPIEVTIINFYIGFVHLRSLLLLRCAEATLPREYEH